MIENGLRTAPAHFEGVLARLVRRAARGRYFLPACASLALVGTFSASFPVTAIVVPAALLAPARWRRIALSAALGSALGATLLVEVVNYLGWDTINARFPQMMTNATWRDVVGWVSEYGIPALFAIAISPLPQTPALIFLAIARHDALGVFVAILLGKLVKYAVVAWAVGRFPERFAGKPRAE